MSKISKVFGVLGWTTVVAIVVIPILMGVRMKQFEVACSRYIERATRTNDVEKAISNLDIAIDYIEQNGYTEGNTSIFIKDPDNDMAYWYENLIITRSELENVRESTPEEQSNVLMKARETLTYNDDNGSARIPDMIAFYPYIKLLLIVCFVIVLFCCLFFWLSYVTM